MQTFASRQQRLNADRRPSFVPPPLPRPFYGGVSVWIPLSAVQTLLFVAIAPYSSVASGSQFCIGTRSQLDWWGEDDRLLSTRAAYICAVTANGRAFSVRRVWTSWLGSVAASKALHIMKARRSFPLRDGLPCFVGRNRSIVSARSYRFWHVASVCRWGLPRKTTVLIRSKTLVRNADAG